MPTPQTMLRDSALGVFALVVVGFAWGGLGFAGAIFAGGALALLNFFLLSRLVARLVAGSSGAGALAAGMMLKALIALGGLWGLLQVFDTAGVFVGLGATVLAVSVRGAVGLFAVPGDPQEV